jgi:hypothetical protein
MVATIIETLVESTTLTWFASLGYASIFGPDIAPCELAAELEVFYTIQTFF